MEFSFSDWIISKFGQWLLKESPPRRAYLCDFHHICEEIRPGDVLLIEGRSRSSRIIQRITLSPWTHAALYIGQLNDIDDPVLRAKAKQLCSCTRLTQLLIESEIGLGTVISSVIKYQRDHIRILRPHGLSHEHVQKVIQYAIARLGKKYNIRHLLDLARFLFPWGFFPRQWKSSLFQHNALQPTEDICSSMIADAFHSIHFPILPLVREDDKENLEIVQRNPRLFTPNDFDFSPYFDVIKYPIFKLGKHISPEDLP
jgi:permuted papain-like amidase YaeF/Yiix C92 family enzyme